MRYGRVVLKKLPADEARSGSRLSMKMLQSKIALVENLIKKKGMIC